MNMFQCLNACGFNEIVFVDVTQTAFKMSHEFLTASLDSTSYRHKITNNDLALNLKTA